MPPVRTAKKNSSSVRAQPSGRKTRGPAATNPSVSTPPSPAEARSDAPELLVHANAPLPELGSSTYLIGPGDDGFYGSVPAPPPKVKVEKAIHFRSNAEWEDGWRSKIGRPTKKLKFGSGFVLTDQHIEQLASLGPEICRTLTHVEFVHQDIDAWDGKDANKLTDDAATRLARMCPRLRVVQLRGAHASRLTDAAATAFLANCPALTSLEITGENHNVRHLFLEAFFDALREHPGWAPKLKTLRIAESGGMSNSRGSWMRAMRTLSRERETLLVQLVGLSRVKKRGDLELVPAEYNFRKGRKFDKWDRCGPSQGPMPRGLAAKSRAGR